MRPRGCRGPAALRQIRDSRHLMSMPYREDLDAAYARIATLERRNHELELQLPAARATRSPRGRSRPPRRTAAARASWRRSPPRTTRCARPCAPTLARSTPRSRSAPAPPAARTSARARRRAGGARRGDVRAPRRRPRPRRRVAGRQRGRVRRPRRGAGQRAAPRLIARRSCRRARSRSTPRARSRSTTSAPRIDRPRGREQDNLARSPRGSDAIRTSRRTSRAPRPSLRARSR